jgi:fatty acid-binding protein DegV
MGLGYAIVVDSTSDIPPQAAEEWGLEVIPYIFTLGGKEYYNYLDYRQLSVKDFYNSLRNGTMGSTTQVTPHRYMECWEPFLKEGKDVLYMCLSSMLSKSYEQSMIAATQAKEEYPTGKLLQLIPNLLLWVRGFLDIMPQRLVKEGNLWKKMRNILQK